MESISAIILAGGKGIRLKKLFPYFAKPLVNILDKPFIFYLIKQLNKYEFKAIEAKVMQNDKIAETLKATKNAKLIKENTNMHTHSHVLYNLMLIRQKLINN